MELLTIIIIIIFITIVSVSIYFIVQHNKSSGGNNPTISCPPGEILDANGDCVPYKPTPPSHTCPTGQVWDQNTSKCIPYNPSPAKQCPTGQVLDPKSGNCVWIQCPNGEIRDKNGICVIPCNGHGTYSNTTGCTCYPPYTGANCQCDETKIPSGYANDLCRGIGDPVCNTDGTWSLNKAPTCEYMYKPFGENNQGVLADWQEKCYSEICKGADPTYNHIAYCDPGTVEVSCQQQCSVKPDTTKCANCMPDGPNTNETCVCDGSSTPPYNWYCEKNQKGSCPPEKPVGLCDSNGELECIQCADNIFSWHCSDSANFNKECMKSFFGLDNFNTTASNAGGQEVNWFWNTGKAQGPSNPVFPSINNDTCDSRIADGKAPYSTLQYGNFYAYPSVNSQNGFVTGLKNNINPTVNNTKFYIHDPNDKNLNVYNIIQSNYICGKNKASVPGACFDGTNTYPPDQNNSLCKDGTSATEICLNGDEVTGLNIGKITNAVDDGGQSLQYKTGCMKFPNQYCNGRGTFSQYCFAQDGNKVECNDPNVYYMDDGGSCTCNPQPVDVFGNITPYAGSSCQYSDVINCNNHGSVSVDGNDQPVCKCQVNYAGNKCQFNNTYCNNHGSVSVDEYQNPSCECEANYYGVNCEKEFDTNTKAQYINDVASWSKQIEIWKQKLNILYNPSNKQITTDYINFGTNLGMWGFVGSNNLAVFRVTNGLDPSCVTDWYLDGSGGIYSNKMC